MVKESKSEDMGKRVKELERELGTYKKKNKELNEINNKIQFMFRPQFKKIVFRKKLVFCAACQFDIPESVID